MQFRRVDALPPYAFAEIERLKLELRRAGEDVIDLGFGNPDVAPPELAVEKLREAALLPRNHRYSASRGLPNLRAAVAELYRDRYGVELDPQTEITMSLGAKEGLVHLLWVLLGPGDVALVPSPSYPIHLFAPGFAGAAVQRVPADVVGALARLKSYLDYGSFQPLQIAATVALREARERPAEVAAVYEGRRDALCDNLSRIGWDVPRPKATMFVWARIPTDEEAQAFALRLLRDAHVAVSPGSGFGADGEGYVRFALVENEQRIAQAVRGIKRALG